MVDAPQTRRARGSGRKTFFKRLPWMREKRPGFIAALDTETDGLDGELLLATAFHETWSEAAVYKTLGEFLDHILFLDPVFLRKTVWYSHNAEYDWRYLINYFREYDDIYLVQPCERMKGKFFELAIYHKQILTANGAPTLVTKFRDSMALYPQSLKQFTKQFAPEFEKQDIGLAWRTFDPNDATHVEYAKNDAVGLVWALVNFDKLVWETFGTHSKATTAGTAYNAMLRAIPDDEYHNRQGQEAEAFFRRCYYGGRVQLNGAAEAYHRDVTVFDINSSYPAAMRLGIPWGKPTFTMKYNRDFPGFYHCIVQAPEGLDLPLIPHRDDKGRLSFPHGEFETHVSSIEMEYARALGYSFKVIEGYYFEQGLNFCFNDLIDTCENLRTKAKGTALETVVKLIQNSVYGKFGTKPEGREVMISFNGIPDGFQHVTDEETGAIIPYFYFQECERDSEYMLPHYAAWITANARIKLDQGMRAAGAENVLYADTDSLHMLPAGTAKFTKNEELVGKRYGQYKLEKTFAEVRYHAPKSYTFRVQDKQEFGAVYKGIPANLLKQPASDHPNYEAELLRRNNLVAALHAGDIVEVEYHSSASMQSYLKTGKRWTMRRRKNTRPDAVYSHRIVNGQFRPILIKEDMSRYEPKTPQFKIVRTIASPAAHWIWDQ